MSDTVDATLIDERPVTYRDFENFKRDIDIKLDAIRRDFQAALDGKAPADVTRRLDAQQDQMQRFDTTLNSLNLTMARLDGSLGEIRANSGERLDSVRDELKETRHEVDIQRAVLAGFSEDWRVVRSDLYGSESGEPAGLFRTYRNETTRLVETLNDLPERQAQAIATALEPVVDRLGSVETKMKEHDGFIAARKRIEAVVLNAGKRGWTWLTSRPQSARWSAVIAAGVLVGGWLDGQPVGQVIELVVRRLLGLP